MLQNIAVLTSGNDSPGMNAAIRAIVRTASAQGVKVWGVHNGYKGLLRDEIELLDNRSVGDMIHKGGTFLGTARSNTFMTPEGQQKAADILKARGIEGLIVIGGSGSLKGAAILSKLGLCVVGIPATIENDVWGTDYTIGSDTAANTVVEAINKLRDTASAHRRIILIEVMGKTSGWLALTASIAGGAEYVIVPEAAYNLDYMSEGIRDAYDRGKRYSIIVVSEGAASAVAVGKEISQKTGIDTRVSVLGHIQRGGSPTVKDRINATLLAERATKAIIQGRNNVMFGYDRSTVVEHNMEEAVECKKTLDTEMIRLSHVLA